ncbi:MAG: 50S ribosomal protein L30 [Actinomycetota bacterium]|nr:50S ribosomal protein L30 [Actinomycetota bacterium]
MAEIVFKQVRSSNGANGRQLDTLRSLNLGKIGRTSAMADTPQVRGMLKVVGHLVAVEES